MFSSCGAGLLRDSKQMCAGAGVQELTRARVSAFQPEQDQEWIFLIGTEAGVGVIFNHRVLGF